jgi:hypothetical protein
MVKTLTRQTKQRDWHTGTKHKRLHVPYVTMYLGIQFRWLRVLQLYCSWLYLLHTMDSGS